MVLVLKNQPAITEDIDLCSIPEPGKSPGGRHDKPLQYSCLENPKDRGAWPATVHGVTESDTTATNREKEELTGETEREPFRKR